MITNSVPLNDFINSLAGYLSVDHYVRMPNQTDLKIGSLQKTVRCSITVCLRRQVPTSANEGRDIQVRAHQNYSREKLQAKLFLNS